VVYQVKQDLPEVVFKRYPDGGDISNRLGEAFLAPQTPDPFRSQDMDKGALRLANCLGFSGIFIDFVSDEFP